MRQPSRPPAGARTRPAGGTHPCRREARARHSDDRSAPSGTSTRRRAMLTAIAILWVLVWCFTLVDLFRRNWGTGVKVAWAIGMLILPVVGVIAYLIVRPPSSADVH